MAQFNVDVGGVPAPNMPDQTGASRGSIPNRSFEELFKGVGDVIDIGVKGFDQGIRQSIDKEATNIRDTVLEPYNLPGEVKSGTAAIANLQAALDQGKISDTYYYGQLTSLTKNLRSRYPGYEDVVDEAIMKATGVRPANAYRDAIMSEIDAQQREAKANATSEDTWLKQNEALVGQLYPDYFTNPEKYDFSQVRVGVVNLKSNLALIDQENSKINYLKNQDSLNEEQAVESATTATLQVANTFLTGAGNSMGLNAPDFLKKIQDGTAQGFTEEQYTQMMAQFGAFKANLRTQLYATLTKPLEEGSTNSYASILGDPTKVNQIIDQAMAQVAIIEDALTNKDYGMAAYYTRLNSLRSDRDKSTVLDASPELRTVNAIGSVSKELADIYWQQSGKQEEILAQLTPEISSRIAGGQDDFNSVLTRMADTRDTAKAKTGGINALVDTSMSTITSGKATPEQVDNTIKSLYAIDENGKDLFGYVNEGERYALYNRLFNPEVTKSVIANGSRQALELYYGAAVNRIGSISSFKKAAGSVEDLGSNWADNFKVKFNPTTGRIDVEMIKPVAAGGMPSISAANTTIIRSVIQGSVNELNGIFDNLSPILDGLGADEAAKVQAYEQVLGNLNVSLENGKKEGFFEWLQQSLSGVLGQVDDKSESTGDTSKQAFNVQDTQAQPTETGSLMMDTIVGFEGYRDTPYWDVNALRTGFGSDTVTDANGNFSKVKEDTVTTREDSMRDLQRRLSTEFLPKVIKAVGEENWLPLSEAQKAALASIAYNYGELPKRVAAAVKTGDPVLVEAAIRTLQTDNEGVNRDRRNKEADLYMSS
jgi:GH24 family phage-related lysozyme (muramidase)